MKKSKKKFSLSGFNRLKEEAPLLDFSADDLADLEEEKEEAEPLLREEAIPPPEEFVIQRQGQIRQAGTLSQAESPSFAKEFRERAERSLFVFSKGVLKKWWLLPSNESGYPHLPLHRDLCQFLTDYSKSRHKMMLIPRETGKTTIVCHSLPLHILIQPKLENIYTPNVSGDFSRVLIICENAKKASDHINVLEGELVGNELLRNLWPERVWWGKNPTREASKWNSEEFNIPRSLNFPDPSVRGLGITGAFTGSHPNILIKDDIATLDAANSPTIMETAIKAHKATRNLVGAQKNHLEFVIGTRWAAYDVYRDIMDNDSTVEYVKRSIFENPLTGEPDMDGEVIYPVIGQKNDGQLIGYTREILLEKKRVEGDVLFTLNYMNDDTDPSLVDFPLKNIRFFEEENGIISFEEDERDSRMRTKLDLPRHILQKMGHDIQLEPGKPFDLRAASHLYGRGEMQKIRVRTVMRG